MLIENRTPANTVGTNRKPKTCGSPHPRTGFVPAPRLHACELDEETGERVYAGMEMWTESEEKSGRRQVVSGVTV